MRRMSGELRAKLTKVAKSSADKTKGGLRKARQKALSELKNRDNVSKDTIRKLEKHVSCAVLYIHVSICPLAHTKY